MINIFIKIDNSRVNKYSKIINAVPFAAKRIYLAWNDLMVWTEF